LEVLNEALNEAWTIDRTVVGRYSVIYNSATIY
jgi:hypothetical protein